MKINSLIFLISMISFPLSCLVHAKPVDLNITAQNFLLSQQKSLAANGYRSEVELGNISTLLAEKQCATEPELALAQDPFKQQNNSIEITCRVAEIAQWRIFVSASIDIYSHTLVAQRSIPRGVAIDQTMLEQKEVIINKSRYPQYDDPSHVVGMITKRTIRQGAVISPNHLRPPKLISRGDRVVILAKSHAVSVKMHGTALNNGAKGQQISVKNNRSERIVRAHVVDRGLVQITL